MEKKNSVVTNKSSKLMKIISSVYIMAVLASVSMTSTAYASADDVGQGVVKAIVDALKKISRYVGLGIVAFGVYEIAMSFMQQQPEAKTKGITMAVVGAILIGISVILDPVMAAAGMK